MKKLTKVTYQDIIRIIESQHFKQERYDEIVAEMSSTQLGVYKSRVRKNLDACSNYLFDKYPQFESISFPLYSEGVDEMTLFFDYNYDENENCTGIKNITLFFEKECSTVFRKKIVKGKKQVESALKNKALKDSYNREQRERKRRQKRSQANKKKAEQIYI